MDRPGGSSWWVSCVNETIDRHTCPHGDRADKLGTSGCVAEAAVGCCCGAVGAVGAVVLWLLSVVVDVGAVGAVVVVDVGLYRPAWSR